MMLLKLVPDSTNVRFIKMRAIALVFSAFLVVGSLIAVSTLGLNFGVDFRGGVTIEVADDEPLDIGEIRDAVTSLGLGDVQVQAINDFAGSDDAVVIFIEQQTATTEEGDDAALENELAQEEAAALVRDTLTDLLGDGVDFRKTDIVGPTVSGELVQKGALAVALAIGMMLIYIWLRFEWQFSVGAIVALVHDVIITLGMFAVTRLDFNLATIAAILTIVGYSMNDTVVVYDRVRENLRKYKQKPLSELLDQSINETLARTVMTSLTTMLALVSLAIFGGEVLRSFTLAMIWGVVIGTYSSIFVASPFLMATNVKRDWSKVVPSGA
ncbi:protein translocase subunit SecF [Hyphococcus sp. ECK-19]|uniref:Protein-export membrane protein SecF n=2 Tax=Hyphococcus lacteus TaxID=3143536 RepID=A0ABV3Z239_9PROT